MITFKKFLRRRWNSLIGLINFVYFLFFDLSKIKKAKYVFILPVYHTGGAEKVHLNIVKTLSQDKIVVFFTENSSTQNFLSAFTTYADIIEINSILTKKNKWVNALLKLLLVHQLNNSRTLKTVFGSNTYYFYELIREIRESIIKIDLFHAFNFPNDHRENIIVASTKYIDHRILINAKAMQDIQAIYSKNNVGSIFYNKLMIINNGINLLNKRYKEKNSNPIKIGFIGRWSEEKRPKVYLEIAKQILLHFDNVAFIMAGIGMKANIAIINEAGVSFLGEMVTEKEMNSLYEELSFIIVPSKREGFPMVIMEAMANGVIPIATDVGGVSEHVVNQENGILISEQGDQQISNAIFEVLRKLLGNKTERERLSQNAYYYAQENFGIDRFQEDYKKIFEHLIEK